jgi:hypothetical protein
MGAKTWMLVGASGSARDALAAHPELDRDATMRLAKRLFPKERLEPLEDGNLSYTCPPDDEVHIGCFPGVSVVAAKEFGIDYPSRLDARFLSGLGERTVYLHAMHSVVDWLAFAVWQDGELRRSLSLSPDSGVLEDQGPRLSFELPYWSGEHPAIDPEDEDDEDGYPFPFHPLELGEVALKEFFGYQIEGFMDGSILEARSIALMRLRRKPAKFRFW